MDKLDKILGYTNNVALFPAYGRKYPTLEKAFTDWASGKDFAAYDGKYFIGYTSVRDVEKLKKEFDNIEFWNFSPAEKLGTI